jgi:hypothetical protein
MQIAQQFQLGFLLFVNQKAKFQFDLGLILKMFEGIVKGLNLANEVVQKHLLLFELIGQVTLNPSYYKGWILLAIADVLLG